MKLNTIPVHFNQEAHTYTHTETGETYQGITGTLLATLFPDKYDGVPQDVMERAARRGTLIHEELELIETIGIAPSTIEGENYLRLREEYHLRIVACEHTVSDLQHFATNIDAIYEGDEEGTVDITDYKTTARFDRESVSWQLSICAYLLEKNNPHLRVGKLFGTWLRGDIAKIIPVERHSAEEVETLISAYLNGETYEYTPAIPAYITLREDAIYQLAFTIRTLTEQMDAFKEEVLQEMIKHGHKSFDTGRMLITCIQPATRTSFDAKKFKEEHPEQYSKYLRETQTKETLKLTIR